MLIVGLNLEFPGAGFVDGEGGHQTFRKRTFLGGEGVEGGTKSGQRPTPRWASWWPRVAFFWGNELLHFHAYSLIKYTYYQLGYTEIGTQTLQKRKSWGARTWVLVGTALPR